MQSTRRSSVPGRAALLLFGAAVVAIVIVVLVRLRGSGGAAAAADVPRDGGRAAAAARPVAPRLAGPAPAVVDTDQDPQLAMAAAVEVHQMEVLLAGDVPQEIMRAVAPCYHGEPGRSERMDIDYTLHLRGGVARLSDVALKSSQIRSPRLEQCAVDVIKGHTWRVDGAPDLDKEMTASISILDLQKRNRRFGE